MKNHAWRPFAVAIVAIALLLFARAKMVPADFGVHGKSFTYNFYRQSAIHDWQDFKVKYKGSKYCEECHEENYSSIMSSPHQIIQCENCHGPAIDHPDNPEALEINKNRSLCLRCHTGLPYPLSNRNDLPAIDPDLHNPGQECVECHNPHNPSLEDM